MSDFLKQSLYNLQIPVVKTDEAIKYLDETKTNYVDTRTAVLKLSTNPDIIVYTNSENALNWIYQNHPKRDFTLQLEQVKNKVTMRDRLNTLHPGFYYKEIPLDDFHTVDPDLIPFPVVLKPAVGFFSLGVHTVSDREGWRKAITEIQTSLGEIQSLYPDSVLSTGSFIVEEVIAGKEYAVDCYFDANGEPVIFNIMKHLFASEKDVNDRVYITSNDIMMEHLASITSYLEQIGSVYGFKYFPAHIELRIDRQNVMNIVEINPIRFGGWCSTPDLAGHAWGINVYEYLHKRTKPNWTQIVNRQQNETYALVVLNNSTGLTGSEIHSFNYDSLLESLDSHIELRRVDYRAYPLFGFVMCKTPSDDLRSLIKLLHSDLTEFVDP